MTRNWFLLDNLIQNENSDSALEKITKGMVVRFKEMIVNGAHPQIVANLIVQIIHTKVPEIKYPVGENGEKVICLRNKMNDTQFEETHCKNIKYKMRIK